jgi:hypothetical protein
MTQAFLLKRALLDAGHFIRELLILVLTGLTGLLSACIIGYIVVVEILILFGV